MSQAQENIREAEMSLAIALGRVHKHVKPEKIARQVRSTLDRVLNRATERALTAAPKNGYPRMRKRRGRPPAKPATELEH